MCWGADMANSVADLDCLWHDREYPLRDRAVTKKHDPIRLVDIFAWFVGCGLGSALGRFTPSVDAVSWVRYQNSGELDM